MFCYHSKEPYSYYNIHKKQLIKFKFSLGLIKIDLFCETVLTYFGFICLKSRMGYESEIDSEAPLIPDAPESSTQQR